MAWKTPSRDQAGTLIIPRRHGRTTRAGSAPIRVGDAILGHSPPFRSRAATGGPTTGRPWDYRVRGSGILRPGSTAAKRQAGRIGGRQPQIHRFGGLWGGRQCPWPVGPAQARISRHIANPHRRGMAPTDEDWRKLPLRDRRERSRSHPATSRPGSGGQRPGAPSRRRGGSSARPARPWRVADGVPSS